MLRDRIISSFFVLTLSLFAILFCPNWFFSLIVTSFTAVALFEFYSIVEKKKIKIYKYFGTFLGILVPVFTYLEYGKRNEGIVPFSLVLFAIFVILRQFSKKKNGDILASTAITLFGIFYISWFFSFIIKLKFLENGTNLVLFLIILTEGGDVGAYFVGSAAGKHPLIPRISPKKTVEGTLAGFFTVVILSILCRPLVPGFTYPALIGIGIVLGITVPVADLAESLFKRDCGVKDSGSSLPGLGGVLDMLDSLLIAAPVFYFYIIAVNAGNGF